ncbi:MAG: hypothetical protein AAF065_13580 [Verrucomicrobiota bacterium]
MAEKNTLIQSIPPIRTEAASTSSSDKKSSKKSSQKLDSSEAPSTQTKIGTSEVYASEQVASSDAPVSISLFQGIVYGSFVVNLVFAGLIGVFLMRRVRDIVTPRYAKACRIFGGICLGISLHGVLAAFLYSNFLWGSGSVPIFFMNVLWIFAGPALAFVLSHLLTRFETPVKNKMFINAAFYGGAYLLSAIAVSAVITVNAGLVFSLISIGLFLVPILSYFQHLKLAYSRHAELREPYARFLTYTLLYGPWLIPVLALAKSAGLSAEVVQLLLNLISIDLVVFGGLGLALFVKNEEPVEESPESEAAKPVVKPNSKSSKKQSVDPAVKAAPKKPNKNELEDPIIQFLNDNPEVAPENTADSSAPTEAAKGTRLPNKSDTAAGFKIPSPDGALGASDASVDAKNAPEGIRPPRKPKKRF